jgi:hypothetical protein
VILTLQAAPNPASYRVGVPAKAAVIILNRGVSNPSNDRLEDGSFHLVLPSPASPAYRIEASSNLKDWETIITNSTTQGAVDYVDPDAIDETHRFYRVIPESSAPADDD